MIYVLALLVLYVTALTGLSIFLTVQLGRAQWEIHRRLDAHEQRLDDHALAAQIQSKRHAAHVADVSRALRLTVAQSGRAPDLAVHIANLKEKP